MYKADPFNMYHRSDTHPNLTCVLRWSGPKFVVDHGNCLFPVFASDDLELESTAITRNVDNECKLFDHRADTLIKPVHCDYNIEEVASVKFTDTSSYIYCSGYNITFFAPNRTIACPDYVFSIPLEVSFQVSSIIHQNVTSKFFLNDRIFNYDTLHVNSFFFPLIERSNSVKVKGLDELITKVLHDDEVLQQNRIRDSIRTLSFNEIPLSLNHVIILIIAQVILIIVICFLVNCKKRVVLTNVTHERGAEA